MGEEEFFIDQITEFFVNNILTKNEKEFNLNILYAKDTNIDTIVSICKKYPLMSDYQLVIIKEAQDLGNTIENLSNYLKNALSSTILVVNYNRFLNLFKNREKYLNLNFYMKIRFKNGFPTDL